MLKVKVFGIDIDSRVIKTAQQNARMLSSASLSSFHVKILMT